MGGPKGRNHSRITDDLPEEIRREVDRLLMEESLTYDDIAAFLAEKGYDISRSAIGRYGKGFMNHVRRLRIIEDKSRTLVSDAGDGMILEEAAAKMFSQQIIELLMEEGFEVKALPRIISDFAKLQTSSALRERMKSEIAKKADKALENIEAKAGAGRKHLDPETLKIIKEEIYGIV
jgi:hypothetical protein